MTRRSPPLDAAVIGAGLMGRWHGDAVRRCGQRVAAVVDRDVERATQLARRLGAAAAVATLDDVPPGVALDVAHVCTPVETHEEVARAALARGLHALVEKPLTPTAAGTAALLDAAADAGRLVAPVHQFLFQRGVARLEALLHARPGSLLHLELTACTAGAAGRDAAGEDGVALSVLPHGLALARRLTGAPLAEATWNVLRPVSGELRCTATLNGATVALLVSTHGRPPVNVLRAVLRDATVEVDLFHGHAVVLRGGTGRAFKMVRPFAAAARSFAAAAANGVERAVRREAAYPGLRELVRRFYAAAAAGGEAPITATETLDVARALDRIRADVARNTAALALPRVAAEGRAGDAAMVPGAPR